MDGRTQQHPTPGASPVRRRLRGAVHWLLVVAVASLLIAVPAQADPPPDAPDLSLEAALADPGAPTASRSGARLPSLFARTGLGIGSTRMISVVYDGSGLLEQVDLSSSGCCYSSTLFGFDDNTLTPHLAILASSQPASEEAAVAQWQHGRAGMAGLGVGMTAWWVPDRLWTSATVYLPWLHILTAGAFTAAVVLPQGALRALVSDDDDDDDPWSRTDEDDEPIAADPPEIHAPFQAGVDLAMGYDQPVGPHLAFGLAAGVSRMSRAVPMVQDRSRVRRGTTLYGMFTVTIR